MRQFQARRQGCDYIGSVRSWQFPRFGAGVQCFLASCAVLVAAAAYGAPLGIGQTIHPTPAEVDPTGGIAIAGPTTQHYITPNFSGDLVSTVIAGDPSNPFGGLTFEYRVSNDAASINVNARLSVNGYTGFLTDGSFQIPASGVIPAYVDRPVADVVGFSFLGQPVGFGPIQPGQTSALLVVQTNATTYSNSFASVIDGTIATIPTYAPAPEPAAFVLLGLGGLALIRRRR